MDPEGGRVKRTGCCKLTGSGAVEPQPEVEVGEVPDYESNTCRLCQGCSIRAQALFDLE